MKKIMIVGVPGRTATLFAEELKKAANVLGVGRRELVENIKKGNVFVSKGSNIFRFDIDIISKKEIHTQKDIDYLFITTKNPVSSVIKEYLPEFEEKIPNIVLSQNGFKAAEEAKEAIDEIFGSTKNSYQIIRLALFNSVREVKDGETSIIEYKTPIRVAFSVFYGTNETDALEDILKNSGIEYTKVPRDDLKNMEYSKLFTNLIGIPSYSLGLNIEDGLRNKDAFKEEMLALKEYVAVVKKSGGHFLNLPHYPIATFASLVEHIPLSVLLFFRPTVTKLVLSLRHTKEKGNIDEIDYYTGAIIDLGRRYRVEMPINERVLRRIKNG